LWQNKYEFKLIFRFEFISVFGAAFQVFWGHRYVFHSSYNVLKVFWVKNKLKNRFLGKKKLKPWFLSHHSGLNLGKSNSVLSVLFFFQKSFGQTRLPQLQTKKLRVQLCGLARPSPTMLDLCFFFFLILFYGFFFLIYI
jgi:hypothetical protein